MVIQDIYVCISRVTKQRITFFGFSTFNCERFMVRFTLLIINSNKCMSYNIFILFHIVHAKKKKKHPMATTQWHFKYQRIFSFCKYFFRNLLRLFALSNSIQGTGCNTLLHFFSVLW